MAINRDDHKKLVKSLQTKLLDLSRKNNLINYKFGVSRSRPNIRVVDEIPDIIYSKIQNDKPLLFKGIPVPKVKKPTDENTEKFKEALDVEISQDLEYQKLLVTFKEKPNKKEEDKALDVVRDRVRVKLNIPPVDRAYKFTVTQEAQKLNINVSEELLLETNGQKHHTDNSIQTLMFEPDLEA